MSLMDKLNGIRDQAASMATAKFGKEIVQQFDAEMDKLVEEANQNSRAPKVGDTLPEFILTSDLGQEYSLSGLLEKAPLIISFNRGNWCPFCRAEIQALETSMALMNDEPITKVVISPQLKERSEELRKELDLTIPILYDVDNKYTTHIGLQFKEPPFIADLHQNAFGIDMNAHYGDSEGGLPIPAVFVVNRQGVITYAYINPNWQQRADPEEYIQAAQES